MSSPDNHPCAWGEHAAVTISITADAVTWKFIGDAPTVDVSREALDMLLQTLAGVWQLRGVGG